MSKTISIEEWTEGGKSDDVQLCEKRYKTIQNL